MKADICFLLEGTYPYVAGGVSTWVDQMIRANPHLRFAIVNMVATEESVGEFKYQVPDNVTTLRTAFLHDSRLPSHGKPYHLRRTWDAIRSFYQQLPDPDFETLEVMIREIMREQWKPNIQSLLFSKQTWNLLMYFYGKKDISFIDFFWTFRFTHLPLMSLLCVDIPSAHVYHAASTGYAGVLGCLAKIKYGSRLLLTEHGLYAKERKIEISNSNWVYDERKENYKVTRNMGYFRQWWIDMFMTQSKLTYKAADVVTTLYQGNYDMQIEHGCPREKLVIIPNGIDVDGYAPIAATRRKVYAEEGRPFTIGFVGRVTPIKDVKTFIRAIKIVKERLPHTFTYMMGPLEEDPDYVDECKILIDMFEMNDHIEFTGRVNVKEYYPKLDLVLLTSVSEGLPFVILEAHAAGIPCVSTDVGACRDLLYGLTEADRALGPSGLITHVSSPDETAEAILRIATDREFYLKLCETALKRVDRFYRIEDINASYTNLYHDLMRL